MRRLWLILCLLPASISAQVVLEARREGKVIGQARVSHKLMPNGGKSVEMLLTLGSGVDAVHVREQSVFAVDGAPVRKLLNLTAGSNKVKRQVLVTFREKLAHVVIEEGGVRTIKEIPVPAGASIANPAELWFVRTPPNPGLAVSSHVFNLNRLAWEALLTEYLGRAEVALPGGKVRAHRVTVNYPDRKIDAYLDDRGLPLLLIDSQGLRLERIRSTASGKTR